MTNSAAESAFLSQLDKQIEQHIADENFGVSELADAIGMSRSNLLRKIKKLTKLSASQYIRQVRLKKGMELLRQKALNVSEVSYAVGFGSTSYFIKCFREYYGHPPGEVGLRSVDQENITIPPPEKKRSWMIIAGAVIAVVTIVVIFYSLPFKSELPEKSIAVLPFKNDSNDSTNVYLINGLMEATLNNLQQIKDLRVISRTSVEKYRNTQLSIPEIAQELGVSYFVEGSGQKIGKQILLNIQLIEASNDQHLWGEQYQRELKDIFQLQKEVAKKITSQIRVVITPEEQAQIGKTPTENLVAYDLHLQGMDLLFKQGEENLRQAVKFFRESIKVDPMFARPYAEMAGAYYMLDLFLIEKNYTDSINYLADQAILLDDRYEGSLVAKALYYRNIGDYHQAIPYLEKALTFNPNAARVLNLLLDTYNYAPNKSKYLEYSLKGIRINVTSEDSISTSFLYLHVSNALIQAGFVKEAEHYINKSLDYNSNNIFSQYVKAYILYTKDRNIDLLQQRLYQTLAKDTTRLDVLQETAKISYTRESYDEAAELYQDFLNLESLFNYDIFPGEDIKIAWVMRQVGNDSLANALASKFKVYNDNNESIYQQINSCAWYAFHGEKENAMKALKKFADEQDDYFYWIVFFLREDPILKSLSDQPGYEAIMDQLDDKFWEGHAQTKEQLEEMGLI